MNKSMIKLYLIISLLAMFRLKIDVSIEHEIREERTQQELNSIELLELAKQCKSHQSDG